MARVVRDLTVLPPTHVFMNDALAFPAEAGPHFTDPWGMKGWVDMVDWLDMRM